VFVLMERVVWLISFNDETIKIIRLVR
jgi:hypothetical protein